MNPSSPESRRTPSFLLLGFGLFALLLAQCSRQESETNGVSELTAEPKIKEVETSSPATPAPQPPRPIEPTLENVSRVRSSSEFASVREALLGDTLKALESYDPKKSVLLLRPQLEDLANRWYYLEKATTRAGGMSPPKLKEMEPRIAALEQAFQNDVALSDEVSRAFSAYGLSDCTSVVSMLKEMAGIGAPTSQNL